MKRSDIQNAYQYVKPDEDSKDRMLSQILLSSEISPAGKGARMMRKKVKPMVLVAIMVIMVMLMGCAIVLMTMEDLKIGERTSKGEILDSEGNVLVEKDIVQEVLSLHGLVNSPAFLAHQEWFEFYEDYNENHEMTEEENFFVPPEAYQGYFVYNQDLIDKVDEIVKKYDLKLLGACSYFQSWESDVFHEATGLNTYLASGSMVVIEEESGYFYQGGNFKVEFDMSMPEGKNSWPHTMLNSLYYSKSDNFDTIAFHINNPKNIEQWNYTTAAGDELLIINSESGRYALVFCVRTDAMVYLRIDTSHENAEGDITFMSKQQLEQVADQFDYSLNVDTVDMDLAKSRLEQYKNSSVPEDTNSIPSNFDEFVRGRINQLGMNALSEYFILSDINNDGINDLVVGSLKKIEFIWTMKYGQMDQIMAWGENFAKLEKDWPDMDKKPITKYFAESENHDKDGYQRYIDELLSMEHPENSHYVLSDINNDGTQELLIGDTEVLSYVWRVNYSKNGYPNIELLSWSMTEDELNNLKTAWPNMDRKPVTEYYSD